VIIASIKTNSESSHAGQFMGTSHLLIAKIEYPPNHKCKQHDDHSKCLVPAFLGRPALGGASGNESWFASKRSAI